MPTYRSVDFWAPALHPNTLLHVAVPEPGPSRDPIVRHFPIKHNEHEAVGNIKRILKTDSGLIVADDQFRVSSLSLPTADSESSVPEVLGQVTSRVPSTGSTTWTGLASVGDSVVSALSSGRVTLYRGSDLAESAVAKIGAPVLTLSAPSAGSSEGGNSNTFALAGKELELTLFDAERAFAPSKSGREKRGKDDPLPGEVWRAKNVPHNNLQLRQPIYHLASAFMPGSRTDILTGTKSGNLRRYDTRQRRPVGDWHVAREGGVRCVVPGAGRSEHEVFFADHSQLVGVLDVRSGKVLYNIPSTATAHALVAIPDPEERFSGLPSSSAAGLAALASDATMRLCATTPLPAVMPKGNWTTGGKKGSVVGMVGGVGVGEFVFDGFGSHEEKKVEKEAPGSDEEGEEDEEVDDDEEEELWDGMEQDGDEGEDWESSDEEDAPAPAKKQRRK